MAPSAAGEAHRIAGVLDALRLDGPATVVGHSIAGFHAEAFARLHPDRAAGVVLVDASVEEHARVPAAPAVRTALARAVATALSAAGAPAALGPLTRRAVVRLSRPGHAPDPAPDALVRRCYATSRVLNGALLENTHYRAVAAELLALRERHPLPPGVPVTVLAAPASTRWTGRQRALADLLGARFEAVPGTGHLMMLDRPQALAEAVLGQGSQETQSTQSTQNTQRPRGSRRPQSTQRSHGSRRAQELQKPQDQQRPKPAPADAGPSHAGPADDAVPPPAHAPGRDTARASRPGGYRGHPCS